MAVMTFSQWVASKQNTNEACEECDCECDGCKSGNCGNCSCKDCSCNGCHCDKED